MRHASQQAMQFKRPTATINFKSIWKKTFNKPPDTHGSYYFFPHFLAAHPPPNFTEGLDYDEKLYIFKVYNLMI